MYLLLASFLFLAFILFGCAPQGVQGGGSIISTLIMLGFIIGIIYIVILVTNRKKQPKIKRVKRKTKDKNTT